MMIINVAVLTRFLSEENEAYEEMLQAGAALSDYVQQGGTGQRNGARSGETV